MRIAKSAHKHGITEDDIDHAVRNAIDYFFIDNGTNPLKMYVGAARDGTLLEVGVILILAESGEMPPEELAIHAMKLRKKYRLLGR